VPYANQPDVAKTYMRVRRASDEQKASILGLLSEVLKLHFETLKFFNDYDLRKDKPLPLDAGFRLKEANKGTIHSQINLVPSNEPLENAAVDTVSVLIPVDNKLESLIPFYRDAVLEFFSKYGQYVTYAMVEHAMLEYEALNFEQLAEKKAELEAGKEQAIFWRVQQEILEAADVLRKSLDLTVQNESEKLKPYRENGESKDRLWLLCMRKLKSEGYEFLEATVATNRLINGDLCVNDAIGRLEGKPEASIESLLASEMLHPWREDSEMTLWCTSETSTGNAIKELVFRKYMEKSLREERVERQWRKQKREELIAHIEAGDSRDCALHKCWRAHYSEEQIKETLRIFEGLVAEGFKERLLSVRLKQGPTTEIVRMDDLESNVKPEEKE